MNITEFLLARIEEDEEAALAVDPENLVHHVSQERSPFDGSKHTFENPSAQGHYERHAPARVLAEATAKRTIINAYPAEEIWVEIKQLCEPEAEYRSASWDIPTALLAIAQPYADHPDFNPKWRLTH